MEMARRTELMYILQRELYTFLNDLLPYGTLMKEGALVSALNPTEGGVLMPMPLGKIAGPVGLEKRSRRIVSIGPPLPTT